MELQLCRSLKTWKAELAVRLTEKQSQRRQLEQLPDGQDPKEWRDLVLLAGSALEGAQSRPWQWQW